MIKDGNVWHIVDADQAKAYLMLKDGKVLSIYRDDSVFSSEPAKMLVLNPVYDWTEISF